MLFLADAVIHGGQFNSSSFIDGFGCPTEKLAEFPKEPQETKVFNFNLEYETFCELTQPKLFKTEAECSLDRLFNLLSG